MNENMGTRLSKAREQKGWKQADAAEAAGIDRSHLSRLENNKKGASVASLFALADLYNLSLDYLRSGSPLSGEAADNVAKNADELSLLRMLRLMDKAQVQVMRSVADQITSSRRDSGS